MDLENCSVSSSLSPSPSSAAEVSDDRLVEMELEAAEALADLAHLAMRESGGGGTVTNWGLKGKRVKSDSLSPPGPSGMNLTPIDPVQHCSDPAEDQVELDQERDETVCSNVIIKQIKAEKEAEPSSVCSTRYPSVGGGGRSRQNLTEAEKEARRVRRVLANRESARQTIRRRQALCEELARKAADLARENESLKRKKDMASKEYKYLETINKHLKTLTAKALKSQVDKFSGELKSAHAEMSVSPSANCPMLLYNHHPFPPVGWPYIIKDSHPLQSGHGLQNPVIIPSNIPTPVVRKLDSLDQENPININTTGAPFYIVPCPWFAPHGNGFHAQPRDSQKIVQDETSRHNGYDGFSSSQSFTNMEKPLYRAKANNEVSDSTEVRTPTDLKNIPVEFSLSKGGQRNGPLPRDATFTPALPGSVGGTSIVNHGPDYTCNTEAISVKANHIANALPEKRQQVANYPSQKVADAIAAAEARKRRKELTKLKHLHGRQCRLHC